MPRETFQFDPWVHIKSSGTGMFYVQDLITHWMSAEAIPGSDWSTGTYKIYFHFFVNNGIPEAQAPSLISSPIPRNETNRNKDDLLNSPEGCSKSIQSKDLD